MTAPRGTIRVVPAQRFEVFDGERRLGDVVADVNGYDHTVSYHAMTWTTLDVESSHHATLNEAVDRLIAVAADCVAAGARDTVSAA